MKEFEALEEDLNKVKDAAVDLAEFLIREELHALEQRLHRHRFRYINGMGHDFVIMFPALLSDRHRGDIDSILSFASDDLREYDRYDSDLVAFIKDRLERISDIATLIDSIFHAALIDVNMIQEKDDEYIKTK